MARKFDSRNASDMLAQLRANPGVGLAWMQKAHMLQHTHTGGDKTNCPTCTLLGAAGVVAPPPVADRPEAVRDRMLNRLKDLKTRRFADIYGALTTVLALSERVDNCMGGVSAPPHSYNCGIGDARTIKNAVERELKAIDGEARS